MKRQPPHIDDTLNKLVEADSLRKLRILAPGMADFSSNDYLGLARSLDLEPTGQAKGAGGSRLLSGNHPIHEALERACAEMFRAEAALVYSSGYMANIGLLSAIATRHDTFLYDQAIHASMKDGMRLSLAQSQAFHHNDLQHLEELLSRATGSVFILSEGLFSMDGDRPDLKGMADLAERHNAYLIVDEAHSTGIFGAEGEGIIASEGLEDRVFARVHTFGKAVGRAGAAVLGSGRLREFLVNRSRAFIYTTAIADTEAAGIIEALAQVRGATAARERLRENTALLQSLIAARGPFDVQSPILPCIVPGNSAARAAANRAQAAGLDLRPILAPTVPPGQERLRIVMHSYNTHAEIRRLAEILGGIPA